MIHKTALPADIRRFVLASIPSIPHIEALMLLRSTAPQPWTAQVLASRLYVKRELAAAVLADLTAARLLHCGDAGFAYAAGGAAELVDRLAGCYATQLVEITRMIHSRPPGRS